ncbi:MAG: oligosaccharide flippase family protein [Epulopiscium sp.]|nr:oligosaccharide flippase family protein [Candidatus Epulonipiscium sp.]
MNNNKYKTLLSNTVVFAIGNILVKLVSFFLMPLYTSQLTVEQYGIAELLNSSIQIILPVATLCVIDALFRFSIDEDAEHEKMMSTSINLIMKSFIIVLVVCIVFYLFSGYQYTAYFYLLFVATTLHKLFSQFARGIGHIKRFVASGVINTLTLVVMNVILLVVFNGGVGSYLISLIISFFVAAMFSFFASKEYLYINIKAIDKKLLKKMLLFSIPNIPNMLSWWVNNISSRYVIMFFCGAGMAGMFTAATKIPSMINLFVLIFQQAWQYSTAKEIQNDDSKVFFSRVLTYYSGFVFLICSALIILIPYLARLILQGDFYVAWKYVPLLLVAATLGAFSTYFGTFYIAIKNNIMAMTSTGIGATINIVLNLILVPFIGVYGALISSVVGYLIITIIRMIDTRKHISLNINYKFFFIRFALLLTQSIILTAEIPFAKTFTLICFIIMIIIHLNLIGIIIKKIYNIIN